MYTHCSLAGTDCTLQLYQILIQIPVIWSTLVIVVGLAINTHRRHVHEMSPWLLAVSGLVLFSFHPIGLTLQFMIHMLVWQSAPLGTSLLITGFGLFAILTFGYFLIGADNWAELTQR